MGQRLSKREIPDKFLTPRGDAGLEASEVRRIRKLVLKGKLAPFYPGVDEAGSTCPQYEECPICFFYFGLMNSSVCCGQRICSECYIRIKASSDGSYLGCACPFCKAVGYTVELCEPKTDAEKEQELLEEQRIMEHRLRHHTPEDQMFLPLANLTNISGNMSEEEVRVAESPAATSDNQNLQEIETLASIDPRTSSFLAENEYQEEYEALSSQIQQRSSGVLGLSNAEARQCEEYLGVFPEDLGMRVEEFNEMLLEQVLVSSALENDRRANNPEVDNSSEVSFVADLDGDAVGSQRPDTPHPEVGIVLADELAQQVHRWVNEAADGNREFVGLSQDCEDSTRTMSHVTVHDRSNTEDDPGFEMDEIESLAEIIICAEGSGDVLLPEEEQVQSPTMVPVESPTSGGSEEVEVGAGTDLQVVRRRCSCPGRFNARGDDDSCSEEAPVAGPSAPHSDGAESPGFARAVSLPEDNTSLEFSGLWKALIARLALNGDVDPRYKTPQIGMVFLGPSGDEASGTTDNIPEEDHEGNASSQGEDLPRYEVEERVRVDNDSSEPEFETVAVSNPDGSLMLVKAPRMMPDMDPGRKSHDDRIVEAISKTDACVQEAIAQSDARNNENQTDDAIVNAIARADEDWLERIRRSDEALKKSLRE